MFASLWLWTNLKDAWSLSGETLFWTRWRPKKIQVVSKSSSLKVFLDVLIFSFALLGLRTYCVNKNKSLAKKIFLSLEGQIVLQHERKTKETLLVDKKFSRRTFLLDFLTFCTPFVRLFCSFYLLDQASLIHFI